VPGRALRVTATESGTEVEWRFPRHPRSVSRARATLREQLDGWGVGGGVADTAVLLLSELVTNAVRHARVPQGREIGALFALCGDVLRVEVADASDVVPAPRTPDEDSAGGRGLVLVAAMADDWGVSLREGVGKVVWAVLKLSPDGIPEEPAC
jgi:serine/threonine-protein kinase RsbW